VWTLLELPAGSWCQVKSRFDVSCVIQPEIEKLDGWQVIGTSTWKSLCLIERLFLKNI
jgi:hypothetical protein